MTVPLLIIDPGHGGKDSGGGSNSSFHEKDMSLKISLYQYNRFKQLKVPITMTRFEDEYLSPAIRTEMVKKSGAKYCISNHINAAVPEARGVETIYSIYSDSKLAKDIYQAIVDAGMNARRYYSKESEVNSRKDYYYMHRETGIVDTVIIEYGFATNQMDSELLINHWKQYAEAVVEAFCRFTGITYEPEPTNIIDENEQNNYPTINGRTKIQFEEKEIPAYLTDEGKTIVEIREIARLLNINIEWNSAKKIVELKK